MKPAAAQLRCTLTGVPIAPDALVLRRVVPTQRARPRYLEAEGDLLAAPLTLHRNMQDGAVGLAYSLMMARYLSLAEGAASAEERRELLDWWSTPYGRERVLRGLLERLPEKSARHVLEVVSLVHRTEADPYAIAARFGHTEQWLLGKIDWCMKLAHSTR